MNLVTTVLTAMTWWTAIECVGAARRKETLHMLVCCVATLLNAAVAYLHSTGSLS